MSTVDVLCIGRHVSCIRVCIYLVVELHVKCKCNVPDRRVYIIVAQKEQINRTKRTYEIVAQIKQNSRTKRTFQIVAQKKQISRTNKIYATMDGYQLKCVFDALVQHVNMHNNIVAIDCF